MKNWFKKGAAIFTALVVAAASVPSMAAEGSTVEKYEASHDNQLPVIGKKDSDFVFDEYKTAIIDKDAKKAADKAKTKYFS